MIPPEFQTFGGTMSQTSTHLSLPYIQGGQAQKHVTHNEALRQLDLLVQLSVLASQDDPATAPVERTCFLIFRIFVGDDLVMLLQRASSRDGGFPRALEISSGHQSVFCLQISERNEDSSSLLICGSDERPAANARMHGFFGAKSFAETLTTRHVGFIGIHSSVCE